MNYQPLLNFATDLAYRAGRITLGYFNTGIRPEFKSDDTPVTVADRASEEFIRGEIEKMYPKHAIVGEEYGDKAGEENPFRWIIDPIDGTKSFIRGIPLYSVLIGLEIEGKIQVGAAYFPGLDEMLCAGTGLGCWWNGRRAQVSQVASLDRACICYTSYDDFHERDAGLWQRLSDAAYMLRGWSDAYGYLAVATGRAEVCLDPIIKIWDIAPFPVIMSEAGGHFGGWTGQEGHTHGEGFASNSAVKSEVLKLLEGR